VNIIAVGSGKAALKYLSPYVFRVAINNQNILALKDGRVTFRRRHSFSRHHKTRRHTSPAVHPPFSPACAAVQFPGGANLWPPVSQTKGLPRTCQRTLTPRQSRRRAQTTPTTPHLGSLHRVSMPFLQLRDDPHLPNPPEKEVRRDRQPRTQNNNLQRNPWPPPSWHRKNAIHMPPITQLRRARHLR